MIASRRAGIQVLAVLACLGALPRLSAAQDGNVMHPPAEIEQRLRDDSMELLQAAGSRFKKDRTQRTLVRFADSTLMRVKFAAALPGADAFNNEPRYELAAYVVQKLFLDPADYVVPPTVVRCFPVDWYRKHVNPHAERTFGRQHDCVLTVLQYWLWNVHIAHPLDEGLFQADTVYARHLADFNTFTYLVHHEDSNLGNFLVSDLPKSPRIFSVDNGVAFRSPPGNRGQKWHRYLLDRIGAHTVARLRTITRPELDSALLVLAQWDDRDGKLVRVPPGPCLDDGRGVRDQNGVVQIGLTSREIDDIESRLHHLLGQIDNGDIRVF